MAELIVLNCHYYGSLNSFPSEVRGYLTAFPVLVLDTQAILRIHLYG